MARMMSLLVKVGKETAYGEWREIRGAMGRREISEREVKMALSDLIEIASGRRNCPERESGNDAPAKDLWLDVFFFVRNGVLSEKEVSENLHQLRILKKYLPIPARVRNSWPRVCAVSGEKGDANGIRRLL